MSTKIDRDFQDIKQLLRSTIAQAQHILFENKEHPLATAEVATHISTITNIIGGIIVAYKHQQDYIQNYQQGIELLVNETEELKVILDEIEDDQRNALYIEARALKNALEETEKKWVLNTQSTTSPENQ